MSWKLADEFHFADLNEIRRQQSEGITAEEIYKGITTWARQARRTNPSVFDALTEWILDDSQWAEDNLAENEQILMQGVFVKFKEQNTWLRMLLKELEASGVVNAAVFKALDIFDSELDATSDFPHTEGLSELVTRVFSDFTIMKERSVRERIAGERSGPTGTDSVAMFGYINYLKGSDAQVQWALFMPDLVNQQQKGFTVENFDYKQMPSLRFIGVEDADHNMDTEARQRVFAALDAMPEYKSGFDYDLMLTHHFGRGVNVEPGHRFWGRFMKADTPVPEGLVHWDFLEDDVDMPYLTFRSEFALAIFSGDTEAMIATEGFDVHAMYDVTRNIILGQGVIIPYPEIYWTAEVYLQGFEKPCSAFIFSVITE